MRDSPITEYIDLFPTEIRRLKGERFVLHNGALPLITEPKVSTMDSGQFKSKWAKNKKGYRKGIIAIKTSLMYLNILSEQHGYGAVEMRLTLSILISGLESMIHNCIKVGFENKALEKSRGIKMWVSRSPRYKTLYKIYYMLQTMGAEIPALQSAVTITRWKLYDVLIGKEVGRQSECVWHKLQMDKPHTLI
jgi:hypothetical protein